MKKLLTLFTITAMTTSAMAQGFFFEKSIPGWIIVGKPKQNELNAVCILEKGWRDGSMFSIFKDLNDGELYIVVTNNGWEIQDNPGQYNMRINFHYSNGAVNGSGAVYELLNKNTIRIRGIKADMFLRDFVNGKVMKFIMPGSINNIEVPLDNSTAGIDVMIDCIKSFKNIKEYKGKSLDL